MRVIPPLTITDARLTSSSVAEPDTGEAAYSSGTTYALDALAIRTATHRVYKSLQAGNTAHTPETSPTWWQDVGPTNRWAMFDLLRNTATVETTSPLVVVVTPARRIDSIAILGSNADTIMVTVNDGTSDIYTMTADMDERETLTWREYFFGVFRNRPSLARFDLPPVTAAIITVTLSRASGSVECGACVLGSYVYLGEAEYNASNDVLNFSSVNRDADGTATMVQRRNVPKTSQRLWIDKARVNSARRVRDDLNAIPAVYSALDDDNTDGYFEALLIAGFYRKFTISVAYPTKALIDIELEEV